MNCIEYETTEIGQSTVEHRVAHQRPRPVAVQRDRRRSDDEVAGRVTDVLNMQLARGSMPA